MEMEGLEVQQLVVLIMVLIWIIQMLHYLAGHRHKFVMLIIILLSVMILVMADGFLVINVVMVLRLLVKPVLLQILQT